MRSQVSFLAAMTVGVLLLFAIETVLAREQVAKLSLYVFRGGRPVEEAELRVDNESRGQTNESGAVTAELKPGEHRLALTAAGRRVELTTLRTVESEDIRIIVTLRTAGLAPILDVQTSHPDKDGAAVAEDATPADRPRGTLIGRVVSADDGEPVANARVFVSGTTVDAVTDEQGQYRLEAPAGSYSLSVVHPDYSSQTVDDIAIQAEADAQRNIQLTPAGLQLEEYVVVEPYIEGSVASVIQDRREAASVSDVLGAEQISRSGDSDAAAALKRVTGLTVQDGKFVYVRGLGERYSKVTLNGADIPSPDPTRRVVPLDLFPASLIEAVNVQKGFTPAMPGQFGGGTIRIDTVDIPESDFFEVSFDVGFNTSTTFQDGLTYDGGELDFLGFDDGARELPADIRDALSDQQLAPRNPFSGDGGFTPGEIEQLGESLAAASTYEVQRDKRLPNFGLSLSGGQRFDLTNKLSIGYRGGFLWGQDWETVDDEVRRRLSLGGAGGELVEESDQDFFTTDQNVGLSGFGTLGLEYGDNHSVRGTFMALRQTRDRARVSQGTTPSQPRTTRFVQFEFEENALLTAQAQGEHRFPFLGDLELDWRFTNSDASREQPNERNYRFEEGTDGIFRFSPTLADSNEQVFEDLVEDHRAYGVDLSKPFSLSDAIDLSIEAGFDNSHRERDSQIRRFNFGQGSFDVGNRELRELPLDELFSPEFIGPNGFQLTERTNPTDSYSAIQDIDAYYGNLDLSLYDTVRLSGGVRIEENFQEVRTFELFAAEQSPTSARLDSTDILPAANVTWMFSEDMQLRASFAETVSRPQFREISAAPFRDPLLDITIFGNPDLRQTEIQHWDLRWEWFLTESESITVGGFFKELSDPIERIQPPGNTRRNTFANVDRAQLYGAEVAARKNLDFLASWAAPLFVSINGAYVESEVSLGAQQGIQTNAQRALEGQAPWVVNFRLGYDSPGGDSRATLLYNVSGPRIVQVGTLGRPDVFQQPFHELNLVLSQQLSEKWRMKLKLKNLINPRQKFTQGGRITRAFTDGRELSLSFTWDF